MTTVNRFAWLDVARWVALIAMFVAHVAPSVGRADVVLAMGDFVALALFATTMGAGAQLGIEGYRRARSRSDIGGWLVGSLVRGILLVMLGMLTEVFDAQIVGVLVHLGVLAVVISWVVLLPRVGVAGVAVASFAAAPWIMDRLGPSRMEAAVEGQEFLARALDVLGGGAYYRLPAMLAWACVGVLIVRWWRRSADSRTQVLSVAVGTSAFAVFLGLLQVARVIDVTPYDGSYFQIALSGSLCAVIMTAAIALVGEGSQWAAPLATAGSMALTLYVAQHAFLGWWVRNGSSDDTWVTLLILTVGGTLAAVGWRMLPLPAVLSRGLLDGPVSWASNAARDSVSAPNRPAA
ncbi:hypothetical protein [Demetria terragena]|uniref:hypothetical protein n=1 Tax=Demetria terragena TaxID=63959 RepID=UPI000369A59B|nr:hypothetical protein [Demetria terragena]